MFFKDKIYVIRKADEGTRAAFAEIVSEQLREMMDPLADFVERVKNMPAAAQQAAISAFVSAGRDKEYPDIYCRMAESSLRSVRFLTKRLIPDFPDEVTEDNLPALAKAINLRHVDPAMEHILQTRDARKAAQEESHGD